MLKTPQALDIDAFAEFHLELTVDSAYLSQDGTTLGCTCFNGGYLKVWDETSKKELPVEVEEKWVLLDTDLLKCENEGRIRFTIVHECAHWILHRRFFVRRLGAALLMPEPTVKIVLADKMGMDLANIQPMDIDYDLVTEMAALYNVSHDAMRYRFRDLGIIDEV